MQVSIFNLLGISVIPVYQVIRLIRDTRCYFKNYNYDVF